MTAEEAGAAPADGPPSPAAVLRSRKYLGLLVLAGLIGVPVSALAYWFLALVAAVQQGVYTALPVALGFAAAPLWWPVVPLGIAGVLVGVLIRYAPGRGGESPADGFHAGGYPGARDLGGIAAAAAAGIGLGVVVGPEAPLIALGGGLAVLAVRLARRGDVPSNVASVVAASGSFAAVSTLFGSPLAAAFLMMEASGLGGATATMVLIPGLLGSGLGYLVFLGLDSWTGYGIFSLAVSDLPAVGTPTLAGFAWALVIGAAAAPLCWAIRWAALRMRTIVLRRTLLLTPVVGLVIAGLAILYSAVTGHAVSEVLFSGQDALGPLLRDPAAYGVGALLLLVMCKGLAYSGALAAFRGGPTFPAMFIGAVGGTALAHVVGLDVLTGAAIGMAAMTVGMLRLPMTSVLLATLFLGSDGLTVIPLVIVGVVTCYVVVLRLPEPLLPTPEVAPATTGPSA